MKLNALSIFQGKNTSKMQAWEKLLSDTIETVYGGKRDPGDQYRWIVAKSMVGCFVGLFVKNKLLAERFRDL